jgi:hypothetical protein
MTDEEFKKRLSEVAEWEIPKLSESEIKIAKQKARGKGRPTKEQLYQEEHEEIFLEIFNGINPTYTPVVTKVKHCAVDCECGRRCETGCQQEAKGYVDQGKRYWRWKCKTCGMTKNPYTDKWDLDSQKASIVWNSFLRESKGVYQSKGNIIKDRGIIRSCDDIKQDL